MQNMLSNMRFMSRVLFYWTRTSPSYCKYGCITSCTMLPKIIESCNLWRSPSGAKIRPACREQIDFRGSRSPGFSTHMQTWIYIWFSGWSCDTDRDEQNDIVAWFCAWKYTRLSSFWIGTDRTKEEKVIRQPLFKRIRWRRIQLIWIIPESFERPCCKFITN